MSEKVTCLSRLNPGDLTMGLFNRHFCPVTWQATAEEHRRSARVEKNPEVAKAHLEQAFTIEYSLAILEDLRIALNENPEINPLAFVEKHL
jgi:hypothetical protein